MQRVACSSYGPTFPQSTITFNDRRTILRLFSGLTENNFSVDTKNNNKLPIREHIYSIANVISEGIDYFKELYERQVISEGIDYFCKKFSTIPVVEYFCERKPLGDEITFEQLCKVFCYARI